MDVAVKPETRDRKGFFIHEATYKLIGVDQSGWGIVCLNDATCHYVDPDDLQLPDVSGMALD
jgi:hypothetical protein